MSGRCPIVKIKVLVIIIIIIIIQWSLMVTLPLGTNRLAVYYICKLGLELVTDSSGSQAPLTVYVVMYRIAPNIRGPQTS